MSFYRRILIPRFGGMNVLDPPHAIRDDEAQVVRDVRLDRNRLEARRFLRDYAPPSGVSWTTPVRFFGKLHSGTTIVDVAITDGNIYRDYSSIGSGLDPKLRWTGFIHNGIMYLASEGTMRVVGTSSYALWGIEKPAVKCAAAEGADGDLDGDYLYKYTFENADGIESDASPASDELTVSKKKIDLSAIAVSTDPQVTKRNVYRIGGLVPVYTKVKTIDNNVDTTYTDEMDDATASSQEVMSVSDHDHPASCPIVVLHLMRAFYAGHPTHPNRVYYSASLYPEYSGNYRIVGGYEKVIALCVWESELFVYKQGEIWSIQGSVPATGHIRQLQAKRGTIAPNSVAVGKFPTHVYWDGIYTHDGYYDNPMGQKAYNLFKDSLNKDALPGAVAAATKQMYYVAVPEKGSNENNIIVALNFETRDLTVLEVEASAIYAYESGDIYIGTPDGKIRTLDHDFNILDEDISMQWKSKKFLIGPTPGLNGSVKEADFVIDTKGEDVQVFCYLDGERFECTPLNSDGMSTQRVKLPDRNAAFMELELKYMGQKRPEIFPPIAINPDIEEEEER